MIAVLCCWLDLRWHLYCIFMWWLCNKKWKLFSCFRQRHMNSALSCEKNKEKNISVSKTDIWEVSMSHRKRMKKCRQKNAWLLFNIDSFSSLLSLSLSLSASLWAWKHLNTKFSELFWHSSLCVMTSDSSGDKLKSMSVSAWVFTNLLSGNRIPILETLLYASRHERPHVQHAYP